MDSLLPNQATGCSTIAGYNPYGGMIRKTFSMVLPPVRVETASIDPLALFYKSLSEREPDPAEDARHEPDKQYEIYLSLILRRYRLVHAVCERCICSEFLQGCRLVRRWNRYPEHIILVRSNRPGLDCRSRC